MKGSRFIDGVLVSQDNLTNIDSSKTEAIKERFGSITGYGIVTDSAPTPLLLSADATTLTVAAGECYTDFSKDSVDAGYSGTGERIYVSTSNTVDRKSTSVDEYIYAIYIELHTTRKTDDLGTQHYTKKLDSFILAQLTSSEKDALAVTPYTTTITNLHVTNTDITGLSDNELDDTFGSSNWNLVLGELYVTVTVTRYNSVYLGRILVGNTVDDLDSRPIFYINSSLVDTDTIADIINADMVLHRQNQHSTGIIGGKAALSCSIDAYTYADDRINITDLSTDEYAYVNGAKLESGGLSASDLIIAGSPLTISSTYYIYIQYTTTTGVFTTGASTTYPINTTTVYYMVLCSVYKNASSEISAFSADPRYVTTALGTTNPVTDLRVFGTLETSKINTTAKSELGSNNLIVNGYFEEGIDGYAPRGWYTLAGELSNSSSSGEHSLKLSGASSMAISEPIPYDSSAVYSLSVRAKASVTSTAQVYLRGYTDKDFIDINLTDTGNTPQYNIAHTTNKPISGSNNVSTSWATLRADFDGAWTNSIGSLSPLTSYIKYIRVLVRNTTASDVYVDNVKLIDKDGVTATAAELNILDGVTVTTAELNTALDASVNSGIGVKGVSITNAGVYGTSTNSYGVWGYSGGDIGVRGQSVTSYGVYGGSSSNAGVYGISDSNYGVYGTSPNSVGVRGVSTTSYGVQGSSDSNAGVYGTSPNGYGVYGTSVNDIGVKGAGDTGVGVYGTSNSGYGVYGGSSSNAGVYGISDSNYGVYGESLSPSSAAVSANNTGGGPHLKLGSVNLTATATSLNVFTGASVPAVGDYLLIESATPRSSASTTYTKLKEIKIGLSGTYRVKFTLVADSNTAYGLVYKTGSPHVDSSVQSTTTSVNTSEDLAFSSGDLVQVWGKTNGSNTVTVSTLKLCGLYPLDFGINETY